MVSPQTRRRSRRRRFPFGLVGVAAGLMIAFGVSGASYAFHTSQASLGSAVITTGSLSVSTAATTLTAASVTNLLPGESVTGEVTLTTSNARAVASVSARLQAVSPLTVELAQSTCSAAVGFTALSTTAASLGNFALNETRTMCVRVTVPLSDNTPNTARAFTIIFDATQRQP